MFVTNAFAAGEATTTTGAPEAGQVHTETGVPHDGDHAGVFPPFDPSSFPSQLLWLAIAFGVFYAILKKVVIPRIAGTLEVRHDRIAQDLDQAARMKGEADAAIAAYEQELASARKKAGQIGLEARDTAKAEADADRKESEAALEKKLAAAEARITSIKDAAMKDVGAIAEETATLLVEQLVGKAAKADIAAAVKAVKG